MRARRRAVLYVRISGDPEGLGRGVDRQEEDRTIVLPSGEKVRRVVRPRFRAMLQLKANDGGDVLIAYDWIVWCVTRGIWRT